MEQLRVCRREVIKAEHITLVKLFIDKIQGISLVNNEVKF